MTSKSGQQFFPFGILIVSMLAVTGCSTSVLTPPPTLTGTVVQVPTVSPVPPTVTLVSPSTPEPPAATGTPAVSLSAQGPWLLYVHNSPRPRMVDSSAVPPEFKLLNQDGSGITAITLPDCYGDQVDTFLMEGGHTPATMAEYEGGLYLFRPSQATAMLVVERLRYPVCGTFFSGDEKGGLLASIYPSAPDAVPELMVYELPSGEIRNRFPLVECTAALDVCEEVRPLWEVVGSQTLQWSPNGRYLAFAAILDATSSDLFVYDTQAGNVRRLTHGPDWVGRIDWSPDGTQMIMQDLRTEDLELYGPSLAAPSAVWSVSVSTKEARLLYTPGPAHARQTILHWLDEQRFIAHTGFLDPMDMALNLRFVDMATGTNRILFDEVFINESFDPVHGTLAIFKLESENYPQGIYLISIENGAIRRLAEPPYVLSFPEWDPESGLFVSEDACQDDPQKFQAFDHQGNFSCVPKQAPAPIPLELAEVPSPDGKWNLSAQEGLWLETGGEPAVQVTPETASDVIWCPDSTCFFFSLAQQEKQWTLYHVSLPGLTVTKVDEGIESTGSYQWLGAEE